MLVRPLGGLGASTVAVRLNWAGQATERGRLGVDGDDEVTVKAGLRVAGLRGVVALGGVRYVWMFDRSGSRLPVVWRGIRALNDSLSLPCDSIPVSVNVGSSDTSTEECRKCQAPRWRI
jgi:hypothetical protein